MWLWSCIHELRFKLFSLMWSWSGALPASKPTRSDWLSSWWATTMIGHYDWLPLWLALDGWTHPGVCVVTIPGYKSSSPKHLYGREWENSWVRERDCRPLVWILKNQACRQLARTRESTRQVTSIPSYRSPRSVLTRNSTGNKTHGRPSGIRHQGPYRYDNVVMWQD